MTKANFQRLKAFLLTLLLFGSFALLIKVVRLGHRIDVWKAAISNAAASEKPKQFPSYKERCEALQGVHARLHDADTNVLYDEVCIFGKLPDDFPTCLERADP